MWPPSSRHSRASASASSPIAGCTWMCSRPPLLFPEARELGLELRSRRHHHIHGRIVRVGGLDRLVSRPVLRSEEQNGPHTQLLGAPGKRRFLGGRVQDQPDSGQGALSRLIGWLLVVLYLMFFIESSNMTLVDGSVTPVASKIFWKASSSGLQCGITSSTAKISSESK